MNLILSIIYFLIFCFSIFFFGYYLLKALKFLDIPTNRKIHKTSTVTSGGLLVFFLFNFWYETF